MKAQMPLVFSLVCFSAAVYGGVTRKWTADTAGDLMAPGNYDTATVVPAAGDTLAVDRNDKTKPISGTFTFSVDETPVFEAVNFARAFGAERSLDPGVGKILRAEYLNFRYSDNMSILSGSYYLTQLAAGNSTSSSDLTHLTIDGEGTFIKAERMQVGCGSAQVAQSRADVTVSGGAVVDARVMVGPNGGWKNVMTVTGEGTRVYSTNDSVVVGFRRYERTTKEKEHVGWFHSTDNRLTVADKAVLKASAIHVSVDANSDHTATGNVLSVTGDALVDVGKLYVKGTNSVFLSDGGRIVCEDVQVGYWSYDIGVGGTTLGGGSYCEVGSGGSLAAANLIQIGSANGHYESRGNELRVVDGGEISSATLSVGEYAAESADNLLTIADGAEAVTGNFYVQSTNRAVVSGTLAVTNTIYVGRVMDTTGGIGGASLTVDGGVLNVGTEKTMPTFYIGNYRKQSDGNSVVVTNGGVVNLKGNYCHVGSAGKGNTLTVSGEGSRFVHEAQTSARNLLIGVGGVLGIDNTANGVTVSDGGYLETTASIEVGISSTNVPVRDAFLTVDQATLAVGRDIKIGMGAGNVDSVLTVKGADSRVTANSLSVGGQSSVVFDLSDSRSSAEALVQLLSAPEFAEGARIYVTSSDPDTARSEPFDCTLLSCAEDMDLSGVEIEIDPASGLRRTHAGNAKVLSVCGGLRPGMTIRIK